jgi:hypothetical protein
MGHQHVFFAGRNMSRNPRRMYHPETWMLRSKLWKLSTSAAGKLMAQFPWLSSFLP